MHPSRFLCLLLLVLAGGTAPSIATEILFPKDAPQFAMELAAGWKAVFRDDYLTLLPDPEDGFVMQVNEQPAEATDVLEELTKRIATQMNLINLKLGDSSDAENEYDVELNVLTSRARAEETEVVITVVAFSTEDERHFTVQSVGAVALNQRHTAELLAMMDSIKPLRTGE